MKRAVFYLLFASLLVSPTMQLQAQDIAHYKHLVKELSSAKYQGRGYAKNGANKAGRFLQKEYVKAGADEVIQQPFTIDINTFCGKMEMWADGKRLQAGVDFSMREYSPGVHGEFPVYHVDTLNFDADRMFADLQKPEYANALVCCDFWFSYKHKKEFSRLQREGECTNAGLIQTWTSPIKFYKAYGEKVVDKPIIWVTPEAIKGVKSVRLNVDNKFLKGYKLFNVIAKVSGERHDSCYVFTAHYDHLGNLGKKVFYAGANDNASGTAAIVTLAAYYAKHRPPYDMYFLSFSGEDANLRGSEFFSNNPIVPLEQIKYLFNIDMIGDDNPVQYCEVSDEGMRGYQLFEQINDQKQYFKAASKQELSDARIDSAEREQARPKVKALKRGELAANSDHYPFAKRHVPCIFLENQEGTAFPYYHTIYDDWQHAVFDSYEPVFRLVTDFIEKY